MGKIVITGWNAILKCRSCGAQKDSNLYGEWSIGSSTISECIKCKKVTNHSVHAIIMNTQDYEEFVSLIEEKSGLASN